MPDEYWTDLCAVGAPGDVLAHVDALAGAGATSVAFFPPPTSSWRPSSSAGCSPTYRAA